MEIVSYTVAFAIVTTWGVLVLVTRGAIEQVEILVPVVLAAASGVLRASLAAAARD